MHVLVEGGGWYQVDPTYVRFIPVKFYQSGKEKQDTPTSSVLLLMLPGTGPTVGPTVRIRTPTPDGHSEDPKPTAAAERKKKDTYRTKRGGKIITEKSEGGCRARRKINHPLPFSARWIHAREKSLLLSSS